MSFDEVLAEHPGLVVTRDRLQVAPEVLCGHWLVSDLRGPALPYHMATELLRHLKP